jgi:hypothetical protein
MRARLTKLMAGLTVISAMAFGGAAIAGAATKAPPVNPPAAVDVQQGDQTAPDAAGTPAESSSESASAAETATSESASASESAAASDGPGGHADDPANATADYQFQGAQ